MLSQIVMTVALVFAALMFGIFADRGETAGKATVKPTKKKVLPKGTKILGTVEPVHYALIPRASTLVLPDLRLEEIPSFVPTTLRKREAKALEAKSSLAEVQTHKMKEMDAVESTRTSELEVNQANVMAPPLNMGAEVVYRGQPGQISKVIEFIPTRPDQKDKYVVTFANGGGDATVEATQLEAEQKAEQMRVELAALKAQLAESQANTEAARQQAEAAAAKAAEQANESAEEKAIRRLKEQIADLGNEKDSETIEKSLRLTKQIEEHQATMNLIAEKKKAMQAIAKAASDGVLASHTEFEKVRNLESQIQQRQETPEQKAVREVREKSEEASKLAEEKVQKLEEREQALLAEQAERDANAGFRITQGFMCMAKCTGSFCVVSKKIMASFRATLVVQMKNDKLVQAGAVDKLQFTLPCQQAIDTSTSRLATDLADPKILLELQEIRARVNTNRDYEPVSAFFKKVAQKCCGEESEYTVEEAKKDYPFTTGFL